jgi:hypothetical protein
MTRMKVIFAAFIISLVIACVTPYPQKEFITELWFIDTVNFTISRVNDNDEIIVQNIEDLDPSVWIVVKAEHISGEWEYQQLLIKSCVEWEK